MKMKIIASALILTLTTPLVSFAAGSHSTEADDEITSQFETSVGVLNQLETEVKESKSENHAREKIYRHFERQHKRLVRRIGKILNEYSEKDLRIIFADHMIKTGNVIEPETLKDRIDQGLKGGATLTSLLKAMTTPEAKEKMKAELDDEISKSGSARQYLKDLKHKLNVNWCVLGQVSAGILLVPALITGMIGLVAFGEGLIAPLAGIAIALGGVVIAGEGGNLLLNQDCKFNPPSDL